MGTKLVNTQKVLSPTQISLADYVINPYKGCEFGCLYCYSQENKNLKKESFFDTLGVKVNAPEILEKELKYKKPKRVLLGSTTECFPVQEKKFKLTGKILEILNARKIPYTILSKAYLISDYLELIAQSPKNKIFFTLNFQSDKLIRLFEKKSPLLHQRLEAIRKVIAAKIALRIHIGPFIPYVSGLKEILQILPRGVKEIDVELYHSQQGNFSQIIRIVKESISADVSKKLKAVYANEENYCRFADCLKELAKSLKTYPACKFYCIIPEFNQFYSSKVNYAEKSKI